MEGPPVRVGKEALVVLAPWVTAAAVAVGAVGRQQLPAVAVAVLPLGETWQLIVAASVAVSPKRLAMLAAQVQQGGRPALRILDVAQPEEALARLE